LYAKQPALQHGLTPERDNALPPFFLAATNAVATEKREHTAPAAYP